uniref:Uncharacterized protein n=1 Tax=Setaria viridis TaxID=4556 RepID=A0A4U6TWQ7_SETVI|nr:hypothetical protein SEVIR_7G315632v2 [Setaria viridis]
MLAWWFLRAVLACRPPTLTRSASSLPSPPAAPARRLLLFLFPALPTAVAGDGGLLLQVRALQDRRQGGLPRHAPLLRHGQPPPPPPGSYPFISAKWLLCSLGSYISAVLQFFHSHACAAGFSMGH